MRENFAEPIYPCIALRTVNAVTDGVYTTKMAKHAGTKVKTEEKYKVTATHTSTSLHEEQSLLKTSVTMAMMFN